jgi:hypothetical protein
LKLSQALQTIGLFIGTAWLAAYFLSRAAGTYLKIKSKPSFFSLFLVILSMITWIPTINFAADINAHLNLPESMDFVENEMEALRKSYNQLTELFLNTGSVRAFRSTSCNGYLTGFRRGIAFASISRLLTE